MITAQYKAQAEKACKPWICKVIEWDRFPQVKWGNTPKGGNVASLECEAGDLIRYGEKNFAHKFMSISEYGVVRSDGGIDGLSKDEARELWKYQQRVADKHFDMKAEPFLKYLEDKRNMEAQAATTHDHAEITMPTLAEMSTEELRSAVRAKVARENSNLSATTIVAMRKAQCIEYLENGTLPTPSDMFKAGVEDGTAARNGQSKNAADLMRQAIEALGVKTQTEANIDERKLRAIVKEEIEKSVKPVVTHLEISKGGEAKVIKDVQHRLFPLVLALLGIPELNICLTGPAGSGKTACLVQAAKALNMSIYLSPMNIMTTKSDLGGYMDAQGKYVESSFYKAFKHGGLYIADEFDCCNAGMATWLNAAIANRAMTFPNNETVHAHADFRYCACMNTLGQGATIQYVGRNALDAATLDRFVLVDFQYDDVLEKNLCGIKTAQTYADIKKGGICNDISQLIDWISNLRRDIAANKLKATLSPRASITATRMLSAGIGMYWIASCVVFKGLSNEQIQSLMRGYASRSIGGCSGSSLMG